MEEPGHVENMWDRVVRLWNILIERIHSHEKIVLLKRFVDVHPLMTLCTVIIMLICSVPISFLIIFVFWTALMAFLGFVFVEGIILAMAVLVMGGIVFVLAFIAVSLVIFIILGILTLRSTRSLWTNGQETFSQIKVQGIGFFTKSDFWQKYIPSASTTQTTISMANGSVTHED